MDNIEDSNYKRNHNEVEYMLCNNYRDIVNDNTKENNDKNTNNNNSNNAPNTTPQMEPGQPTKYDLNTPKMKPGRPLMEGTEINPNGLKRIDE